MMQPYFFNVGVTALGTMAVVFMKGWMDFVNILQTMFPCYSDQERVGLRQVTCTSLCTQSLAQSMGPMDVSP